MPVKALTRTPDTAALPEGVELAAGEFAAAAAAAGVPRLVLLSSLAAALEHQRDHGSASQVHHSAIEAAVRDSGTSWMILRPGTFASNLLAWAQPIRFTGGVTGPYPTSAQAPIHEADIADAAATALTADGHGGRIYPMTGPQALTRIAQLETIGNAIGRELTFTEITPDKFRAEMSQYGVSDEIVTMLLDYWRDTVGEPDTVRTAEQLTGRPARTLAEWARDHASDFGG